VLGPLGLRGNWNYAAFFIVSLVSGALLAPFGRLADAQHRLGVIAVGVIAAAGGLLVLPAWASVGGLLSAMALLGAAGAALSVAPGAMVGDIVGARGGTVVAVFQMAGDVGSVAGPLIAGWLADRYGFGTSFVVTAAVALIPLGFLVAARRDGPVRV
jgi:MFS transporter, DHA1 family, multidrug resistance protein